jgi:molybdopterin/thiamine biosynthesis adenylyltransferase
MTPEDLRKRLEPRLIRHTRPDGEIFHSVPETALCEVAASRGLPLAEIMIEALELGIWPERFRAQRGTFTAADQIKLLESTAAVIGAGGLGGPVCLYLARTGVGRIVVCDGDTFDESNLNRQALSDVSRIGLQKAGIAAETIETINPAVKVDPWPVWADETNLPEILAPAQVVLDCLDNLPARYLVQQAARNLGIPFIHCAVAGREGVLMTVFPEDPGLEGLYGPIAAPKAESAESFLGIPTVTPAIMAGFQADEALNVLLNRPLGARMKLLHFDLSVPVIEHNVIR